MDVEHGFTLRVRMRPVGQERARHATHYRAGKRVAVTYTPPRTRAAADQIRAEWIAAGRPRVPIGRSFRVEVEALTRRPDSHTRADGSPAAAWRDTPRRPDVDNVLKLCLDALQPECIPDDALCADARVSKAYAERDEVRIVVHW